MGSFLNCLAYRVNHNLSIIHGRSKCDYCGHVLSFKDLIPVFSYLSTKGTCRYCKAKLSIRYVLSEIICGLVYLLIVVKYGLSLNALKYLIFISIMLYASFADLESHIIPNSIAIVGITNRLIFCIFEDNIIDTLFVGLATILFLTIFTLVMKKLFNKEALGGGDIKLIIMASLYVSIINNVFALLISCIVGIIFAFVTNNKNKRFPFAPSLCFGYLLSIMINL